jgi:hypothetical protein
MLLATLDDVKTFLEKTDTTHDDLLELIITKVSARIELYLNRNLEKTERTQYFDAGRRIYSLPAIPIDLTATLTVTVDDEVQDINDDYFVWESEGLIEFYTAPDRTQPKQVKIVWSGGYTSTTVPEDIQYAAILQSAFVFRRRKDIGVNSLSTPDGSLSVNAPIDLLPEVKSILKSLRRKPSLR